MSRNQVCAILIAVLLVVIIALAIELRQALRCDPDDLVDDSGELVDDGGEHC